MSLGESADGWVAVHLANSIEIRGEQERLPADTGAGKCGLCACMARPDDDYVIALRIGESVTHFPMQKVLKILLRMSSVAVLPVISPMALRLLLSCCAIISSD